MSKKTKRILAITSAITMGIMANEAMAQENLNLKDETEIINDDLEDGSFASEDILSKNNESTTDEAVKMVTKKANVLKLNKSASQEEEPTNPACFSVTYDENGNVIISSYDSSLNTSPEVVIIPSTIEGKKVVGIGNEAFKECAGIKAITIPEGVTSIGYRAFHDCTGITTIKMPNSLTSIGQEAFRGCTGITTITIPEGVTSIGQEAYLDCTGITTITIPKNVETIGPEAFVRCRALTNIIVSENNTAYKNVGAALFTKDGKTLIKYPSGNKAEKYEIPKGVETLGKCAFSDNPNLKNVIFSDKVESIGASCFSSCTSLETIEIPPSVKEMAGNSFQSCNKNLAIIISKNIEYNASALNRYNLIKYDNTNGMTIEIVKGSNTDAKNIKIPYKILGKDITGINEVKSFTDTIWGDIYNIETFQVESKDIQKMLEEKGIDASNIEIIGDDDELQDFITECEDTNYNEDEYTQVTFKEYTDALASAKELLKDSESGQRDIDEALERLKAAAHNLASVNKKNLQELYEKYKDVKIGNYTDDSYAAFQSALIKAEGVLSDKNAVQEQVDDAESKLRSAADGLEEKQPSGTENNSDSGEGSSSENNNNSNPSSSAENNGSSNTSSSSSHKSSNKKSSDSENTDLITIGNTKADLEILDKKEYKDDVIKNDMTCIGLEDNMESIYKINNDDFKGNVVKLTKNIDGSVNGNNNYLYIKCDSTKTDTLKIDVSNLNSNRQIYVYEFDSSGKPVLIKKAYKNADNTLYINVKNKGRYIICDSEISEALDKQININIYNMYKEGWNQVGINWIYIQNGQAVRG